MNTSDRSMRGDQPQPKRKYILDSVLALTGMLVVMESGKIVLVTLGWRQRGDDFERMAMFTAPFACALGVYVLVQATGRITARKEARERTLAEFHEKAESAKAASKQS